MRKFITFGLIFVSLLFFCDTSHAQDKDFQTAVLQKFDALEKRLDDLDKRLDEMDKRFEIRFTRLEERMNTLEVKIEAVNQRIDDKFNLIGYLLGLLAAILALPSIPKLLERFKAPPQSKEDLQRLEKQIEQINTQLAQLTQAMRPAP